MEIHQKGHLKKEKANKTFISLATLGKKKRDSGVITDGAKRH